MAIQKHLTLSERIVIERMLFEHASFKSIARVLSRDCSTISKEVRNHCIFKKTGSFGQAFNDCSNRSQCSLTSMCDSELCKHRFCRNCFHCHLHCNDYKKETYLSLSSPPYVCNGCSKRNRCSLEKHLYSAPAAQKEYELTRSESRSGISISETEAKHLDDFISPLLLKGQSIHHICVSNQANIMYSEKTIYNYVDAGILSARNLDLPRKVRYRPRKTRHDSFKVDKSCRIGRTYHDFLAFLEKCPDCPIVQMDSVEGIKGGKVLLTIHFVHTQFMLAFLRDHNTAASVSSIFEQLYWTLRPDRFIKLFPVLLGDNGSEFSDPISIERDSENNLRTKVFYCNPSSPFQKGAIENNHEFIRRILPKGVSFDSLTQSKVNLMMNHINSYARENLGNHSPYEVFSLFYGKEILELLGASYIQPNDIILRPELLQ